MIEYYETQALGCSGVPTQACITGNPSTSSGQAGFVRTDVVYPRPGNYGHNLLASKQGRPGEALEGFGVSSAERLNVYERKRRARRQAPEAKEVNMSAQTIIVEFIGPLSWIEGNGIPSILKAEAGKKSGVYLWTVQIDEGELVYYVGQTGRSFSQRMIEHFKEHMSGGYHLYEPDQFSRGQKVLLWPGRYGQATAVLSDHG